MSFKIIRKIPSPEEIINKAPITEPLKKIKRERDAEIKRIISGGDPRFMVIVGPCSAHDETAVVDYVSRLSRIQEKIKSKILIIPRIYTNKPRTNGQGYKGMLHQPDPEAAPNMVDGLLSIRRLHIRCISESGLTAADEILYPDNLVYVEDMLSYIAVGARSVENQEHRLTVSGVDVPVGMKNPMSGDLNVMFNSIYAAQLSHNFIYQKNEVETSGNPLAHAIMRGSVDSRGESIPNYHFEDLELACELYEKRELKNPFIIVDANHSNSKKDYRRQPRIAKDVLYSKRHSELIDKYVRGLLIESFIEDGAQKIGEHIYGKSITDSCIGIKKTETLLYYLAENL
jgi:3-deoxy-7-phosphoheptulonate synthase